jgi:hypothetical protein
MVLEAFAIAYCRVAAAKHESADIWERETRIMLAIARSLRITVQATVEPRTAARRRLEYNDGPKPWDRKPCDDIEDSDADAVETQCNDTDR